MPEETQRFLICKTMKWDFWTYRAQPAEFVRETWAHILAELETPRGKNLNKDENDARWESLRHAQDVE